MTIESSKLTSIYQKIYKTKKWNSQVLHAIDNNLYLVLMNDDKDFYYMNVGKSTENNSYIGDFSSLPALLKHFSDGIANLSVKKEKMMISNSDNSIQFIIIVKDDLNFELPESVNSGTSEIKLNKELLLTAFKFTGIEYPTNLIHLDSDKGFFVTDSAKILSYNYDNLDISVEKSFPQALSLMNSSIQLSKKKDTISLNEKDGGFLSCPVYNTPDKINPFKDVIKESYEFVTNNKQTFLTYFAPHLNNHGNVNIIIENDIAKMRSHSENSSALQTSFESKGNIKIQFKIKDIENLIPLFKDNISFGIHPDHENIFCIFDDNFYFASI